ncbi:MAG TPA: hypothetical protein VKY74_12945 [Chloroflexia bacterium]|nr:hypothetical protein [Chloroflexia bacterium]
MEAQASIIIYKGPAVLERAFLAAGLAGAILASQLLPGYPTEWRALLPLAVLGLGLWSTIVAYFAAVAVLAYPIWQLSPYLMVLFIAVAIIPHRLIFDNLALMLAIVWSPVLAAVRLELAIPILVGVLVGAGRGALAGALTALWIKLYAAMSGNPLDLLLLTGGPGHPAEVARRFAGAGSLDTLQLIAAPFAPNSSELLANLLQLAGLAGAGAAAGWLAGWGRARLVVRDLDEAPPAWWRLGQRLFWTGLLPIAVAALVTAAALLLVPFAVGRPLSDLGVHQALDLLLVKLGLGGTGVLAVVGLVLAAQPLPPGGRRPADRAAARPVVLPPPDLTPIKTGGFVPAWAAEAGLAPPRPPAAPDPAEPEDLVDLLMTLEPGYTGAGLGAHGTEAPHRPTGSPAGVRPPAPIARDIAIEVD